MIKPDRKYSKEDLSSMGVYYIKHLESNRMYIGSTSFYKKGVSRGIKKRVRHHYNSLKNNRHHCVLLQCAWNKYGECAFVFGIFETIQNKSAAVEREQHYINSNITALYNTSLTAGSPKGYKHTDIARKKIKEYNTGRKRSELHRLSISNGQRGRIHTDGTKEKLSKLRSVPVNQYSISGEFVKQWPSMKSAAADGFGVTNISRVCKGVYKQHNGFVFRFADEDLLTTNNKRFKDHYNKKVSIG